MMKKTVSWLLLGSSVGLVAAGCGSQAPTASQAVSKGPVTISFMEAMSSGALSGSMQHLVKAFESSHKNITVNLIVKPSYGDLRAETEAAVTAGDPPTIAQAYESWAATYAKSDAIVPLGSYIDGSNGISSTLKASIWPGVWKDLYLPDGKVWMWPFNKSDFVMYYNQTWLNKDHLSVPSTWTQFAATAKKVTSASAGTWAFSMDPGTSSDPGNGTYLYISLIRAYGGHIMKHGQPNFDSPQAQAALSYLQGLYQQGAIKLGTSYPGQTALGAQRGLFDLSTIASYYYDQEADAGKFSLQVAPLPKGPAGPGNVLQGTNIVMFSHATTAQKNAAWTFMKWLTAPAQTAYWAVHTGYLPVEQSAISLMGSYYASHPYQKIAATSLAYARPLPAVPGFTEATGALSNAMEEVMVGHESVKTALKQAQQTALSVLSGN